MALVTKSFSDIITFTRASTATFFNSAGVLTSASNNIPRFDYDPATLAARGLLIEEQRTNLLTYSEQFDNAASWAATGAGGTVTANQAVAPDGNTTADQLTFTANAVSGVRQNVTLTAVSHTLSCWMRSISGTATARLKYFNGTTDTFSSDFTLTTTWQRFSFTFTGVAVAGNISINNGTAGVIQNIYIWGAQLEAGAFPTSYIPTTTTALTRSADVGSVNTLAPWFNATEGTLYAEGQVRVTNANAQALDLTDGSAVNRYSLRLCTALSADQGTVRSSGTTQFQVSSLNATTTAIKKMALASANANFAFTSNGSTPVTQTSGVMPVGVNQMTLGSAFGASGEFLNGWLRRITYYPRRLSNAELQAITA